MISHWIAIGIIILIGLFMLKIEHHTRKYKIALVLIFIAILYFSITGMFASNQVDLSTPSGIINGVYLYVGWIGHTASNLWNVGTDTVTMVGNAIKINNTDSKDSKQYLRR